jgi:hypothetical protein
MDNLTRKLILAQGYSRADIDNVGHINLLVRWTPLMCSIFGFVGILLKSPAYFIGLGLCTSIGAFANHSFYDYLYKFSVRFVVPLGSIPAHGNARRFGCAIGSLLYISSGVGFTIKNWYLAFLPAILIITLALIAAVTQWCFASTLYNFIFKKNEKCCG